MTTLPEIFVELVGEGLEAIGAPGASIGKAAVHAYLQRRGEQAREILLDEIAAGRITAVDGYTDDAVAVMVRYLRAAREGSARLNLRLLAKAIAGQLRHGKLIADEFLEHAEALSTLSRDEITVLAAMYRAHVEGDGRGPWVSCLRALMSFGWPEAKAQAVASRSLRSGLVIAGSAYGGIAYTPSPMFLELCRTVDFEDALRRESGADKKR